MPYIRLAADFQGHKAGEIVEISDADRVVALDARAVAKTYPGPVAGVKSSSPRPAQPATPERTAKKATKKAARPAE